MDTATALPAPNTSKRVHVPMKDGRRMTISRKLKAALDRMVWDGTEWNEAARAEGFNVAAMRKALDRPHVLTYLREQKQVFRALASAQNIHHAVKMRDTSGNAMAQLGAMKLIEQIDEPTGIAGVSARMPGVTIVINAPQLSGDKPHAPANPLIEHDV